MSSLDQTIVCNIGSVCMGMCALLLAGFAVGVRTQGRSARLSACSFCLCGLSLLLQLAEISHRVRMGDLSAVMDTIQAVLFAASVLFLLTLIVNAAALLRHRKRVLQKNH